MHLVNFTATRAISISEFGSREAAMVPLASGHGEAHAYAIHMAPGGIIGRHPAGFGQLFLVVQGSGWIEGGDGVRRPLRAGCGACIARGETHAKGSEEGMVAIMLQVTDLAADSIATVFPVGDEPTSP